MRFKGLGIALLFLSFTCSSVFSFTVNNRLLSTMYDRVDILYTQQPDRLLAIYQQLPLLTIKYAPHEEVSYYLQKLTTYIRGKLFTFDQQPNFICFSDRVQKGDTVEINYTIKTSGDALFRTTRSEVAATYDRNSQQVANPLVFNPGYGQVMRGMDEMTLGTHLQQRVGDLVQPRDAYGLYQADLLMTFSGTSLPVELTLVELGEQVALPLTINGTEKLLVGTLVEKTADGYKVDFNHPLAGQAIQLTLQPISLFKHCEVLD